MRLERIYLPNFKNLRDFEIDFTLGSPTTVLVGRNATGKSNLIEAIVTIFRDLDAGPSRIRDDEISLHDHVFCPWTERGN